MLSEHVPLYVAADVALPHHFTKVSDRVRVVSIPHKLHHNVVSRYIVLKKVVHLALKFL